MLLRVAISIALAAAFVPAAPKNRDWQTGTLLDSEHNIYFDAADSNANPTSSSSVRIAPSGFTPRNTAAAGSFIVDRYVVESDGYVYLVQAARVKVSKPFGISANMPLKFAIEKKKLYLLDADGRELQTTVIRRKPKFQPTQ